MRINAYLNFDGNCREAMERYAEILGGKLDIMGFDAMPGGAEDKAKWGDRTLHAYLAVDDQAIMASDIPPDAPYQKPASTYVCIGVDSVSEGRRIFDALAEGGRVEMPFEKTFWSPGYGITADRFGTLWMVNCTEGAK